MAVINVGYDHRSAERESECIVLEWRLLTRRALPRCVVAIRVEKTARIERLVGKILVGGPMQAISARLGNIFNESAAGVAILGRVSRGDDLHLGDGVCRRRALMALLMSYGVAERRPIEEVLRSHGLPAVDAGVELAAAEHGIPVRPHREVPRLDLQERLGEANVGGGNDGKVLIVLFVYRMAHVGRSDVQFFRFGLHLDRFGHRADSQRDVLANGFGAHRLDTGAKRGLESGMIDSD